MITTLCSSLVLMVTLGLCPSPESLQASNQSNEYKIKAAMIYNFLKFIDWPSEPSLDAEQNEDGAESKEFIIGLSTKNEVIHNAFKSLNGKKVKNRRIRVERLTEKILEDKGPDSLKNINVLFLPRPVSYNSSKELEKIMNRFRDRRVLTIGEMDDFLRMGGIINFLKAENHIYFEINLDAAKSKDLQIRTSMLKLAKRVVQKK